MRYPLNNGHNNELESLQNGGIAKGIGELDKQVDTDLYVSFRPEHPDDGKGLAQLRTTIELISRLLEYPSEKLTYDSVIREDNLEAIVPQVEIRQAILHFLVEAKKESISRLRAKYVSLFDFSDKTTLNLTYHLFGEERDRTQKTRRGSALLLLKSLYSEVGLQPNNIELSDYLPMALDFVAIAPKDQAVKVAKLIREPAIVLERNLKDLEAREGREYALLLNACIIALNEFISIAGPTGD